MQKPTGVDITAGLMALAILCDLAILATAIPTLLIHPAIADGIELGSALIAAVCVFFYWKGKEWARWLVMIDAVLILVQFGIAVVARNLGSHTIAALTISRVILAVYLLWYLNTALVRAWFKSPKLAPVAP